MSSNSAMTSRTLNPTASPRTDIITCKTFCSPSSLEWSNSGNWRYTAEPLNKLQTQCVLMFYNYGSHFIERCRLFGGSFSEIALYTCPWLLENSVLTHQVNKSNIEKLSRYHRQQPFFGFLRVRSYGNADKEPEYWGESRGKVEEESFVPRHSRVEENGIVTWGRGRGMIEEKKGQYEWSKGMRVDGWQGPRLTQFVRNLMEEDGHGGTQAQTEALRDGHAHCQTVCQVVHPVSNDNDPCQRFYRGYRAQTTRLQEEQ